MKKPKAKVEVETLDKKVMSFEFFDDHVGVEIKGGYAYPDSHTDISYEEIRNMTVAIMAVLAQEEDE